MTEFEMGSGQAPMLPAASRMSIYSPTCQRWRCSFSISDVYPPTATS